MPLFRRYSLAQIAISLFSTLLLAVLLLLIYPYIPNINAYDAYGGDGPDGPNPQDVDAVPPPVIPCLDNRPSTWFNPEFHSMRPYQASPCGPRPVAYFCNNDYLIIEEVRMRWDESRCNRARAGEGPGGGNQTTQSTYTCVPPPNASACGTPSDTGGTACEGAYIIGGQDGRDYYITLSRAQYPIVGNTQLVRNSQSPSGEIEPLSSVERMNEYVNWYLQGRLEKTEYGNSEPDDPIRYAGPTKLLVPLDFLNLRRLEVAHDAGVKPEQGVNLEEYQGPDDLIDVNLLTGEATTEQTLAHNQIIVCEVGGFAYPCYRGDNAPASNFKRILVWWEGKGSLPWETHINSQEQRFAAWNDFSVWGGITPPFPWLFDNDLYYRKAYREWRGQTCAIVFGNLYCINTGNLVPLACNTFANSLCNSLVTAPFGGILSNLCYSQAAPLMSLACQDVVISAGDLPVTNPDGLCSTVYGSMVGLFGQIVLLPYRDEIINMCTQAVQNVLNLFPASSAARNMYADLYRFIPLGNPSDKNAGHVVGGIGARAPGLTEAIILGYEIARIPVLHYPQTQSTVEVARLLNEVHTPLKCDEATENCDKIDGFGTNYEPKSCTFTQVYTNPGDSLTFNDRPTYLHVDNIRTRVNLIECQNTGELNQFFDPIDQGGCGGITWNRCQTDSCNPEQCGGSCPPEGGIPGSCTSWPECKAEISIEIRSTPKIPFVDQLWKETVVGSNTSFRKIFPKIEDTDPTKLERPVECIAQIPGKTSVTYIAGRETNLRRIQTAGPNTYPGNGPGSQSQGELFFPHLGTVYEYFLKGIQTALRPQGYGSPILNGSSEACAVTTNTGECKMWLFMRDSGGQYYYEKIADAAEATSCDGKHLNPAWALFIALNENAGLMTDDANGQSVDHFGCDQTGAAGFPTTIEGKLQCMLNTLRNDCALGKTEEETLAEYGYPPGYSFGNMALLGLPSSPPPPLWVTDANVASMFSVMLGANYSSFSQFADDFCPNSPELVLPPYQ